MKIKFICNFGGVFLPRPSDGELRYVGGERHLIQINRDMSLYELTCKTTKFIRRDHTMKYHLPGEQLNMLISITSDDDLRNMIEECIMLERNKERLTMYLFSDDDDEHRAHFVVAPMCKAEKEARFICLVNGLTRLSEASRLQNVGSTSTNDPEKVILPSHSTIVEPPKTSSGQPEKTLPTPTFLTRMTKKEYKVQNSGARGHNTIVNNVHFGSPVPSKREPRGENALSRHQHGLQRTVTIMIEKGDQARGAQEKGSPRKEMLIPLDNRNVIASSSNSNNNSLMTSTSRSAFEMSESLSKDHQTKSDNSNLRTSKEGMSHSAVDGLRKNSNIKLQNNKMEMPEQRQESGTPVQFNYDAHPSANMQTLKKSVTTNSKEKQQLAVSFMCGNTAELKPNTLVRASSARRLERSSSPRPDEQSSKTIKSWSVGADSNSLQIRSPSPEAEDNTVPTISELEDPKDCEQGLPKNAVLDRGLTSNVQIIRNEDLEDLREIGSGAFGMVFHGKWKGTDVAIKRIKNSCFMLPSTQADKLITEFWREAAILSKLHHPNILAFYGVVNKGPGGTLATVTEFMVNGSLKKVLVRKDRFLDWRKKVMLAMDAAIGMEYLHSKDIVHFDLKCDNLLVNVKDPYRPICKVGDFGLSKMKQATMVSGGMRGTLPWMAPELLTTSSTKVSEMVDVYSFGIVMWEILTGEDPYDGMHYGGVIGGVLSNTLRPPVPASCNPEWRKLMEQCWSTEPEKRPSFTEVAFRLRAILEASQIESHPK